MTGSVAEAGRDGGTAGRRHRLEIIELLPGDAVGVDHVQAELVGAVDLDTERLSVLLADAVGKSGLSIEDFQAIFATKQRISSYLHRLYLGQELLQSEVWDVQRQPKYSKTDC